MSDLWPYLKLFRRHWLMLLAGLILAIATLFAGIGLLAISGWFLSASAVAGITFGALALTSFNYMTPAGGVRGFAITRTFFRWAERVVTHDATFRILSRLRCWFWEKIEPLSPNALQNYRQADLLNRLVADIDALDHVYLRLLTPLFAALFISMAVTAFLGYFSSSLAVVLGVIMLTMLIAMPLVFYKLGRAPGQAVAARKLTLRIALLDYLQGQAELLLFGGDRHYRQQINLHEAQLIRAQHAMAHLTGIANALIVLVSGWSTLLILWLAADGIGSHTPPGPMLAMVVFLTLASFEALMPLANAFQHLSTSISSARRLNQVLESAPEVTFPDRSNTKASHGQLNIQELQFSYDSDDRVLNNFNLKIAAGEKVALLGKTGCGKSTLLSLITRELQASQGSIMLDNHPLEQFDEASLRQSMAVVTQQVHIFSGTLKDNLLLANPQASDQQLLEALEQMELGYLAEGKFALNNWIGEGGRQLSGGEKRRLGIARALLHQAPLLLLDEPTEGLDASTEQSILQQLLSLSTHKTLLMITHRLAALESLDRICLMEAGTIRCQGSHQELLQSDPYYRMLNQRIGI
ncbi:heme ABC transporter ATP-binding protein/permease CydC [Dongshaea marina]|uniref:heme ABC transporter ATP-binding protein/permease CydC n=1 Tax=Dongshaea marina TaxID=2047966 RepID=UPI000D3ED4C1|nr:cysteine/glutathione ABC transporter ATP-binding protein/permease CydC [Dongshaea marina]